MLQKGFYGNGRFTFGNIDTDSVHEKSYKVEFVIKATDLIHYRFNLIGYTDAKPFPGINRTP